MATRKNTRRHPRFPLLNPVRISWEDQGQPHFAIGKCVEISETGLRIEILEKIRPGTRIQIAAERIKLAGSATVRHVTHKGAKYQLGLELTQFTLNNALAELAGRPAVEVLIENLDKPDQKV